MDFKFSKQKSRNYDLIRRRKTMARDVFQIAQRRKQWRIQHGGENYGPYPAQYQAIRDAINSAKKSAQINTDGAEVLVQGENEKWHTEWSSSGDPDPPSE